MDRTPALLELLPLHIADLVGEFVGRITGLIRASFSLRYLFQYRIDRYGGGECVPYYYFPRDRL